MAQYICTKECYHLGKVHQPGDVIESTEKRTEGHPCFRPANEKKESGSKKA